MAPSNNNSTKVKSTLAPTRRSVQFSPQVSLRVVSKKSSESSCLEYSSWHSSNDIKMMNSRAKSLAKLHYRMRNNIKRSAMANKSVGDSESSNSSDSSCSSAIQMTGQHAAEPTSYEIKGESLRGLEYLTDMAMGKKRQHLRNLAVATAVKEQEHQRVLNSTRSRRMIAQEYGKKTQDASIYSRRVAEEDARVAAAILEEDLHTSSESVLIDVAVNPMISSSRPSPTTVFEVDPNAPKLNHQFQRQQQQQAALKSLSSPIANRYNKNNRNLNDILMQTDLQWLAAVFASRAA